MSWDRRWSNWAAGTLVVAAILALGACAAEGPVKPPGIEQKIEAARTPGDHEEIASLYEQQAGADKAAAERHQRLARTYQRSGTIKGGGQVNLARHCENLARVYQQAAAENLALAEQHRQMAAEAKK